MQAARLRPLCPDTGHKGPSTPTQRRLYRLRPEPLLATEEWLAPYRLMWQTRLDDLEPHLDTTRDARTDE